MIDNTIQFSKLLPPDKLASIFKDFFEQHIAAYYILKGLTFVSLNADLDRSSLIYSVKLLDDEQVNIIVEHIRRTSTNLKIYGKNVSPNIYLNGDLLCISFKKSD